MAKNSLTDAQELLIRDFIDGSAQVGLVLPPGIIAPLVTALGYRILPNGACIAQGREVKTIFGDPDPYRRYPDEYGPDGETFRARLKETDAGDSEPSVETSPGESPEGDAVGDVPQQDV